MTAYNLHTSLKEACEAGMSSSIMKHICELCGGKCNPKDSVCCSTGNNISSHIICMDTPSLIPKSWKCEECAQETDDYGKKRRGTRLINCETARKALNRSRSLAIKTYHTTNTNSLKRYAPSSSRGKEKALNTSIHNSQRNLKEHETSFHEKNTAKRNLGTSIHNSQRNLKEYETSISEKNIAKSMVARYPFVKFDPRVEKNKKSKCDSNVILSRRQNPTRVGFLGNECAGSRLKEDECESTNSPQKLLTITEGTLPHKPVPCANWKGDFLITDMSMRDIREIQAHFPGAVSHKVYDTVKKLVGKDIELKILPRLKIWPKIFLLDAPRLNDVGLYFFPSKDERLKRAFTHCVDMMDKKDLAMVGSVSSDTKLLIFSSVQLPHDPYAAGITTENCMWGVLKHKKTQKNNCRTKF